MNVQRIARSAILIAASVILYRFAFRLPLFPTFLTFDLSEVPIIVGAFMYGPWAGVLLEIVKNLVHALTNGAANPIGIAANISAGCLVVLGTTVLYRGVGSGPRRWLAIATSGLALGLGMIPLNYYFFLPGHGITGAALTTMVVSTVTPFNLVKGFLSAAIAIILYERIAAALGNRSAAMKG